MIRIGNDNAPCSSAAGDIYYPAGFSRVLNQSLYRCGVRRSYGDYPACADHVAEADVYKLHFRIAPVTLYSEPARVSSQARL